ncbi:LPD7 domain-containing protein [Xanthomonas citri]|uniref:LPD7 domain-containing protein n=1 Tax=Xanthomonas citri TaxID=346 RepID=UPI0034E0A30F
MKSKRPARTPPPGTCCTASSHPRRCGNAIDCGARSAKSVRRCTLIRRIVGCHIANGWSNRRPPAIVRLSASYGGAFELTGSEQFKRRAIALMVEHGIDARLRDAEQEALRRAKAAAAAKQTLRRPGKPRRGSPSR